MKELATPINITRPPNPDIEIPNIQLTTICDDGRWYNRDGNGKYYNKQHPIHIIWNGAGEKEKKETKNSPKN